MLVKGCEHDAFVSAENWGIGRKMRIKQSVVE